MKRIGIGLTAIVLTLLTVTAARSFCGFYVAKADTKLFNKSSEVVLVRSEDKTVLTMANDFEGDPKEFAIVIPVPTFIEREQIHVTDKKYIDHLDAYSAPRLVEYFDPDPCMQLRELAKAAAPAMAMQRDAAGAAERNKALGVTIEATYTVGEYDILILSAEQSGGLETWLRENDYKIPEGASRILESYIKQKMRFFVAKVNLAEKSKLGFTYLRPIQVAYESPKFMLPIRLGMLNADGPQELFVFALTRGGRVETTNYRTVKLPSDMDLPLFLKERDEFPKFYKDMFSTAVKKEDMRTVFLEYAWDMNWCDPCAADPLSHEELRELGVFWLADRDPVPLNQPQQGPNFRRPPMPPMPAAEVYVSRLHLRYDNEHFPEDLVFQETGDRSNFQGRYVLRHPFTGNNNCPEMDRYREQVRERQNKEAQTLASLTGWEINEIRKKMNLGGDDGKPVPASTAEKKWYQKLWKKE